MIDGNIIAVSGMMGTGKTTLCNILAVKMGWTRLPEPEIAKNYLVDCFSESDRYAYAAQLAFFCDKAINIVRLLREGKNIIVDRSLYEDFYVFAQYWHDRGSIDDRDFRLYSELVDYFLQEIPSPKLLIYLCCSLEEVKIRISCRDRQDKKYIPNGFLEDIDERYNKWVYNYNSSPIFSIDTERNDIRTDKISTKIVQEILKIGFVSQKDFLMS